MVSHESKVVFVTNTAFPLLGMLTIIGISFIAIVDVTAHVIFVVLAVLIVHISCPIVTAGLEIVSKLEPEIVIIVPATPPVGVNDVTDGVKD